MKWFAILLLLPMVVAQLPHPGDNVVHNPYTIEETIKEIVAVNPDVISYRSYGTSELGHNLWVVEFHDDSLPLRSSYTSRPALYLDANHHGNEHLGMEAVIIFMRELAEWSRTDEGLNTLQRMQVYVSPMVNPDGTLLDRRINMNNVDLNRNYPYNWGLYGTSNSPSFTGGTYRGPSEASEVETQANIALMQEINPRVYLSMHTGSHDIVLPWREAEDGAIPDWNLYEAYLGEIKNVSGLDYREPSGAGESISYAYGDLAALSLIVEVDTTQNDVAFLNGITPMLQEEVEIFWWTVKNFHNIGPNVHFNNGTFINTGMGDAYNLTFTQDGVEVVLGVLGVGNSTDATGVFGNYYYDHMIQGDSLTHRSVKMIDQDQMVQSGKDSPLPVLVVIAALALALARKK